MIGYRPMLLRLMRSVKVILADMKRGMNTLARQVQEGFGRDPHAGELWAPLKIALNPALRYDRGGKPEWREDDGADGFL